jgi:hypothetical protein
MRLALLCVLCSAVAACTPLQTYPGPQLPREQVATVRGAVNYYGVGWVIVVIDAVDGKKIVGSSDELYLGRIEMLPGQHEISASLWVSAVTPTMVINRGATPELRRLPFVAEAGERYIVDGSWGGSSEKNAIWIANERTKEIVGGNKP